ncbi:hypothetical protein ACOMHN_034793 [Nucella lapillus]
MVQPEGSHASPPPPEEADPNRTDQSEKPSAAVAADDDAGAAAPADASKGSSTTASQPRPKMPKQVYSFLFKYVLIGECGVGKSSLLQRFARDTFPETHVYTIGVDFDVKTLEGANGGMVKLQLWDTAGQERFQTITTTYYRGANGVIIVYDMNDDKSLESILKWIRDTEHYCSEDAVVVIVGSKKDLSPSQGNTRHGSEEVREFLEKNKDTVKASNIFGVYEVSAKTGEGVDKVFQDMTDRLVTLNLNDRNPLRGGRKGKPGRADIVRLGPGKAKTKSKCC